jgi:hypothetical protein
MIAVSLIGDTQTGGTTPLIGRWIRPLREASGCSGGSLQVRRFPRIAIA